MQQYEMHPGLLRIFDEELEIDIAEPFDQNHLAIEKEVKEGCMVKVCCFLEGKLHGPSIFYDAKGILLSIGWFCQGVREGQLRQYYPSGRLYASLGYRHGLREGAHKYYDVEGHLRSLMHFKQGLLDGEMVLFWPNGQKKRELVLVQGQKQGEEKFWDEQGILKKEIHHAS